MSTTATATATATALSKKIHDEDSGKHDDISKNPCVYLSAIDQNVISRKARQMMLWMSCIILCMFLHMGLTANVVGQMFWSVFLSFAALIHFIVKDMSLQNWRTIFRVRILLIDTFIVLKTIFSEDIQLTSYIIRFTMQQLTRSYFGILLHFSFREQFILMTLSTTHNLLVLWMRQEYHANLVLTSITLVAIYLCTVLFYLRIFRIEWWKLQTRSRKAVSWACLQMYFFYNRRRDDVLSQWHLTWPSRRNQKEILKSSRWYLISALALISSVYMYIDDYNSVLCIGFRVIAYNIISYQKFLCIEPIAIFFIFFLKISSRKLHWNDHAPTIFMAGFFMSSVRIYLLLRLQFPLSILMKQSILVIGIILGFLLNASIPIIPNLLGHIIGTLLSVLLVCYQRTQKAMEVGIRRLRKKLVEVDEIIRRRDVLRRRRERELELIRRQARSMMEGIGNYRG